MSIPIPDVELGGFDGTVSDPEPGPLLTPKKSVFERFRDNYWFPDDPGPKKWIRAEWPDLLLIGLLLIIPALISQLAAPLTTQYFPLSDNTGSLYTPKYAYPRRAEYITTLVSIVLSFALPFIIMGLISMCLIGSFWDNNSAIMGLSYALVTADLFHVFIKLFIGGLRPHFYEVCKPLAPARIAGSGYQNTYFTPAICTTTNTRALNYAMMSFPSGHATAAFASMIFLAL
ncbi:hypothetical protein K491DRAFT_170521 [Lophiostoma macrostomum CBS 122681]|uniref:Phosphatidic acid phosphatase type 2/haloperoxidase domain-containing protein n=1 Tax=Lophiostoma macrostomum CBS 122681 TaxID=1314788 RepID=A0A6A6STP9_9PLEO|nr:hypothetical protein K491DRAFT_170521 [Lophiostoma macrostomum CBS 122681]